MTEGDLRGVRESYSRDGYVFPLRVMNAARAAECRAQLESIEEGYRGDAVATRILMGTASIVLPFTDEIMRLPSVLGPVKAVLGEDVLSIGAHFWIKEPESSAFVSWHQDLTYWGYEGASEVTAWVALTAATPQNGCMRFVTGSHRQKIVDHRDTFGKGNMLSRGQVLEVEVDETDAVDVTLKPGEMSLHHGHMFHSSNPNSSTDRRIGLALRYVNSSMRQTSGRVPFAHLVSGSDRHGNFRLLQPPTQVMAENDVATALQAIAVQEEIGYEGAAERGRRIG